MDEPAVLQMGQGVVFVPTTAQSARMNEPSWLDINLTRLEQNLQTFQKLLAQGHASKPQIATAAHDTLKGASGGASGATSAVRPLVCGVVKADAYGLGAATITQRLVARGVDMLAVYSASQAVDLLRVSMNCPILIMAPLRELSRTHPLYRAAVTGRLHLAVHDLAQIDEILRICTTFGCIIPVHLYLDTGMSRSGLNATEFAQALEKIKTIRHVRLAGIYSHLASAQAASQDAAEAQLAQFDALIKQHAALIPADTITHIANTFATCRDRRYHRDMVRVGLGLYGYGPELIEDGQLVEGMPPLKPMVCWRSRINHVQRYAAGAKVGYDGTFTCQRESLLGVVPVGYADGYPLALSNQAVVVLPELQVGGKAAAAPVRGRVNMDQMVIDLTDIQQAAVGTMVELISDDPTSPCSLPRLAKLADSNCYELLTRLSPRVVRNTIYNEDKHLKPS